MAPWRHLPPAGLAPSAVAAAPAAAPAPWFGHPSSWLPPRLPWLRGSPGCAAPLARAARPRHRSGPLLRCARRGQAQGRRRRRQAEEGRGQWQAQAPALRLLRLHV